MVPYDIFYVGQIQQDSSECLMMLIEVIDKGSVPYCGSNQIKSNRKSLYCHTYTRDNRGDNNSDIKYVTNTNPEHEYEKKNHTYGKGSIKPKQAYEFTI